MMYFTTELLERFGSLDDRVADQANEEWEERSQKYREHLAAIQTYLPSAFSKLLQEYALHDAEVKDMKCGADRYFIRLRPENADQDLLLTYELAEAPAALDAKQNAVLPWDASRAQGRALYWLYDEVAVHDRRAPWVFLHSILFSDGTELSLKFRDFKVEAAPMSFLPAGASAPSTASAALPTPSRHDAKQA